MSSLYKPASEVKNKSENRLPQFPECFVCGTQNRRGLHLPFYRMEQGAWAEFTPDKECAGYRNQVHGGIISAVLDESVVWAAYVASGRFGVTAGITIRFLKPVHTGMCYTVSGRFDRIKKNICLCSASIEGPEGEVCARAESRIVLMGEQQSDDLLNATIR